MWRLANYLYRAFRNVATHRCPQDIIVPLATVHNSDDELKRAKKPINFISCKRDVNLIIKKNQSAYENFQKLQKYLHKVSLQQLILRFYVIEPITSGKIENDAKHVQTPSASPAKKDGNVDLLFEEDEDCMTNLKILSELNEETMSIINNEAAIEAFETGNLQLGLETLKMSAQGGKNAAALYNLGLCYEHSIGVEKDRAKACDYYRQASQLGHANALLNLTYLSNHIDINDNETDDESEDEDEESAEATNNKSPVFSFLFSNMFKEDQSQFELDSQYDSMKTLACVF